MSKVLTLSKKAIYDLIISQEVSSKEIYQQKYYRPIYPGKNSGITIGLGYDVGANAPVQVQKDWGSILPPDLITRLQKYCGKRGQICATYVPLLKDVSITWEQAVKGFYRASLPRYARMTASIYPELETLHPYEQTAIVGLVYNRGTDLTGDRRTEMLKLKQAIIDDNDTEMASLIRSMERLWVGQGMDGLVKRRELEAKYIAYPDTPIPEDDKLLIEI